VATDSRDGSTEPANQGPGSTAHTSIELFTGGGGLAWAMHEAGFRHLLVNELESRACKTLRTNAAVTYEPGGDGLGSSEDRWPLTEGDVRAVDFTPWAGQVDVVAGGVPCQPWSLGGVHKGYDDPRNLWPELFRSVRETHPKAVLAENVRGLLRPSFKPYYEYILRELEAPFEERINGEDWRDHDHRLQKILRANGADPAERYDVWCLPVNAADYGVPQVRQRVFVIAFRKDLGLSEWEPPGVTHSELSLLQTQADGSYWEEHGIAERPELIRKVSRKHDGCERWQTLRDAIAELPQPLGDRVEHPNWIHHYGWPGARHYPGHTPNDLDRPAKTVKAGVHGVPGGETVMQLDDGSIRYMTVREVARVMTFPDSWQLAGPRGEQMRQLGNAVPVHLGRVMASAVARALKQANQKDA
jgi:site-specific DNA-cytosine methylase